MKRSVWIVLLCVFMTAMPTQKSEAAIWVVVKAAVKKVIKAMDLAVQRLQNQTIRLQNIQKQVENTMSKLRLQEISEWSEKQRDIFKTYYDELWRVRSAIAYFRRIKDITEKQWQLVQEYKTAFGQMQQDKHFSPEEILYIYDVYTGILNESIKNLDQIVLVVNSFSTQMSDGKRLELINSASTRIDQNLSHLRRFTNQNILLSLERARDERELATVRALYGISNN